MAMRRLFSESLLRPINILSSVPKMPTALHFFSTKSQCYRVFDINKTPTVKYKSKACIKTPEAVLDKSRAKIVLLLNFKSAEDALPFYKLPIRTLIHIYKTTKNDEKQGFCENRLYYISSRIQVPPSVLSAKIAKRSFIYGLSFGWIKNSLDVLLDMGVHGERIMRDLWVLKYHHETIHNRLEAVKNMGIDNLYPWMVRCSEDILNRFVSISQETKDILGDTKSTQIYLANRLNTSVDAIEDMCVKIPALKTIRVTKVKHFLDFLINEGFEVEDIASKPRVLSASQKTVQERIEKLRALGLNDINLNVLCRSRKDFKRYCDSIESVTKECADNDGINSATVSQDQIPQH